MKDDRFIELLNLYIDRQITAAETDELEAELQAHPARRIVYRQYCQIHRATTLVGESFRLDAPKLPMTERGNYVRFQSQKSQPRAKWAYYAGGLAAACLAVFFIQYNTAQPFAQPPVTELAAQPHVAQPVAATASLQVEARPVTRTVDAPPSFASLRDLQATAPQDYAALLLALRKEEEAAFANGQIQIEKRASLFDDGVFESQRFWPENKSQSREFRSRNSSSGIQAEFTGFQFQR